MQHPQHSEPLPDPAADPVALCDALSDALGDLLSDIGGMKASLRAEDATTEDAAPEDAEPEGDLVTVEVLQRPHDLDASPPDEALTPVSAPNSGLGAVRFTTSPEVATSAALPTAASVDFELAFYLRPEPPRPHRPHDPAPSPTAPVTSVAAPDDASLDVALRLPALPAQVSRPEPAPRASYDPAPNRPASYGSTSNLSPYEPSPNPSTPYESAPNPSTSYDPASYDPAPTPPTPPRRERRAPALLLRSRTLEESRVPWPSEGQEAWWLGLDGALERSGLADAHREELVGALREEFGPLAPDSSEELRHALAAELERRVVSRSPARFLSRALIAFVGPSGVGKTDAVLQTADLAQRAGLSVGLLSLDAGAESVEQLRGGAARGHAPLVVVRSRQALDEGLRQLAACDLLLMDTASCSPRRDATLQRLGRLLSSIPGASCEVCVDAATSHRNLTETLQRYQPLSPEGMLITRVDPSCGVGRALSAHLEAGLPLGLMTMGDDAPCEPVRALRLAELLLGGDDAAYRAAG